MRTIIWVTSAVLAAAYVIFAYATVDRRDDQTRVNDLFVRASSALEKRDLGGTICYVSENYKDPSGTNYDQLRAILAQALRTEQNYAIEYTIKETRIVSDSASASLRVTVRSKNNNTILYRRDLNLTLTKESGRHALIIPATFWRVTSVDNLGLNIETGF